MSAVASVLAALWLPSGVQASCVAGSPGCMHACVCVYVLFTFPGAAITNYHKPGGFKQQKLSQFWRSECEGR